MSNYESQSGELDGLSFKLDRQEMNRSQDMMEPNFPKSRQHYIELHDGLRKKETLGGEIDCRHLDWEFQCPLAWDALNETRFDDVRFCDQCKRNVYTAYTRRELEKLTSQGECVRVIVGPRMPALMGLIACPPYEYPIEQQIDDSMLLVVAIAQLLDALENKSHATKKFDEQHLDRLARMRTRFLAQLDSGMRDASTLLHPQYPTHELNNDEVADIERVESLIQDENWREPYDVHNREYRYRLRPGIGRY